MPKFPKPEFYIAHWLTSQWLGLVIYAWAFVLPYQIAERAANLKYGQAGMGLGWFSVFYIVQALVTMYVAIDQYTDARSTAYGALRHDSEWQRRVKAWGGDSQDLVILMSRTDEPSPFSYLLVWAYGLIPVGGLAYFLSGPAASLIVVALLLTVVFTIGVSWIFSNEQKAFVASQKAATYAELRLVRQHGPLPKTGPGGLFSLDSLPPIPHHPFHEAVAAAEKAERSSRENQLRIERARLQAEQDRQQREAERIRGLLPILEKEHLRAFAYVVAQLDFDGTADRDTIRRTYRERMAVLRPEDLEVLRASKNPEIHAIFGASRGLR